MRPLLLAASAAALLAQSTEVKEIRIVFDPADGRVRPGETLAVQAQVWGEATAKDGTKSSGRLREVASVRVASGQGWVSKAYKWQGTDSGGFVKTDTNLLGSILQNVGGQFLTKDAVLYTAPETPGTYTIEAEAKGIKGSAKVTVAADAATRKVQETQIFTSQADNNRYRKLAEYWAPYIAQESWWQPKADIPTRFDFDGDWHGDNNWDNTDTGTSQAYVHYAAVETETHWFVHYNFFHPRDYSDNCVAGTCHENDNEGIILTVRKGAGEFGTLELMETLAHNNVYSYTNDPRLRKGAHDIDGKVDFHDGHHPVVFIEAGGHGVLAGGASHSTFSLERRDFNTGTGMTFLYKGTAERPKHGNDRNVGYDLIPIEETWWSRAKTPGADRMFDAPYAYTPFGGRPGSGSFAGSFLGRKHGSNKAKPFWGWHDERTRRGKVLNTGQWALDPAYAVSRDVSWPAALPVALVYIYNPYLGVSLAAAEPAVQTPVAQAPVSQAPIAQTPAAGSCQLEVTVDGSVNITVRGGEVAYEVLSGQPVVDPTLRCDGVMPTAPIGGASFKKVSGRGSATLAETPSEANGSAFRIRVDDNSRGAGRYVLILSWKP